MLAKETQGSQSRVSCRKLSHLVWCPTVVPDCAALLQPGRQHTEGEADGGEEMERAGAMGSVYLGLPNLGLPRALGRGRGEIFSALSKTFNYSFV